MIAGMIPVVDVLLTAVENTVFLVILVGFGRRPCLQILQVLRGM
jgi:hypothetical protein